MEQKQAIEVDQIQDCMCRVTAFVHETVLRRVLTASLLDSADPFHRLLGRVLHELRTEVRDETIYKEHAGMQAFPLQLRANMANVVLDSCLDLLRELH